MAYSSLTEVFTCEGCGERLLKIVLTTPSPSSILGEFYATMMRGVINALQRCEACQDAGD